MGLLSWLAVAAWVGVLGTWVSAVHCVRQMLQHRSPQADRREFTGAAHEFTPEGLRYRRWFFRSGCLMVLLVALGALAASLAE